MPGVLQQISPDPLRSRILSLLQVVSGLSQGLMPLVVGALADYMTGTRGVLTAIVIIALPAWLLGALLMLAAQRPFLATFAFVEASRADR